MASSACKALLSVVAFLPLALASITSNGFSVTLGDVHYFVSPYVAGNISVAAESLSSVESVHGFYPVTVIQQGVSAEEIPTVLSNFSQIDDVYSEAFSETVLFPEAETSQVNEYNCLSLDDASVPSGPYFLEASTGNLYQTYRLYSDWAGAFISSLLQDPEGSFQPLSAQIPGANALTIGVPSRLYYTRTPEKPLAGVRIGVKDIFDLKGVKTSCGNRAYYSLYPPADATALSMQRLIDAGAIMVGKQLTSQFANGESATADWVDYHSPFNPRGDGYQQTSSSSAGAGSSMGSYSWLDIAIGSDTGGSIRGPSGAQGLFGNRPSHGLVDLSTNVMPLATALDTVGFLMRDPYLWDVAQSVMYAENYKQSSTTSYPKKIQVVAGYPTNESESTSAELLVGFLDSLAEVTGAAIEDFNITEAWADSHPADTPESLRDFANLTYAIIVAKDQTNLVRDRFYADYAAVHDGRTPHVNPSPLTRWIWADTQDDSQMEEALANKTLFMDWFNSAIMPATGDDACSESLMIYVGSQGGDGNLTPRDTYGSAPGVPFGFSTGRISVFAEIPDFVYPLGESTFFSNASNHIESLPVAVNIMAAKGCDGMLTKLALDLVEAGIVPIPEAGQTLSGGDVLLRRAADN
ncbi:uncharacterized protein HMPREF1541_10054 [Cyphellophora europaea CBS 101466]|uniref:Amidase domain-containing protein n=1 Tax=Cyphellophora europaea (strain CBS 101466) TaxID=1220924 RepID=W2S922_CYPE1|nr:uncharacterized protein HMPREF1541_10054 [Cyphellophora europaea CBS 101466]ETN45177.1 hypothetical protein HMPREF1541_10054 [Cyphellophora europaea CBS 101466]